ncbi:MAG TPA: MazG family protein [Streptosporangiaceae bacterium]|nr:MazG family protein [Streptosporangiaceae bacterium]
MTKPEGKPAADAVTGSRLIDLVRVMDTLRINCPWDARQTHESLTPYLLEETYEAVDALSAGDQAAVREELGDVLLQVVFHARVAQERTDGTGYTIDDVADAIIDKLTRRHPHVFGDVSVSGPDEVKLNWDAIKAAERAASGLGGPASVLDGVPLSQPALSLAAQLLRRAERAGAPAELAGAGTGPEEQVASVADDGDLGRELFALVNRARSAGLDPELELRAAALAYADRVRTWAASQDWRPPDEPPADEQL